MISDTAAVMAQHKRIWDTIIAVGWDVLFCFKCN